MNKDIIYRRNFTETFYWRKFPLYNAYYVNAWVPNGKVEVIWGLCWIFVVFIWARRRSRDKHLLWTAAAEVAADRSASMERPCWFRAETTYTGSSNMGWCSEQPGCSYRSCCSHPPTAHTGHSCLLLFFALSPFLYVLLFCACCYHLIANKRCWLRGPPWGKQMHRLRCRLSPWLPVLAPKLRKKGAKT